MSSNWKGVCLGMFAALALVPFKSHATAVGYEYWGGFVFKDIPVPGGQLAHEISGKGLHIDWQGASFVSAGNLCDSSMRFTYGKGKIHHKGNVHKGCSHVGQWKHDYNNWKAPRGKACAELWIENWSRRIAKQCHYIYG